MEATYIVKFNNKKHSELIEWPRCTWRWQRRNAGSSGNRQHHTKHVQYSTHKVKATFGGSLFITITTCYYWVVYEHCTVFKSHFCDAGEPCSASKYSHNSVGSVDDGCDSVNHKGTLPTRMDWLPCVS